MKRLALLTLFAFGCGGAPELDGSLGEAVDLAFNTVELKRSPKAIQITYLRSEGREVTARLTVVTDGMELTPGVEHSLAGEYAPGHPRATLVRAVDNEPLRTFPPVARGVILFDAAPEGGAEVSGEFSLSLQEGEAFGAGRTLRGTFRGTVVAVP